MAKARAIDAVALYEQIAAEVSSMLKQPPGIIVSKIMAMVLQAQTIGSSEAKEDVPEIIALRHQIWGTTYRGIYPDDMIDNFDWAWHQEKELLRINDPAYSVYLLQKDDQNIGYLTISRTDGIVLQSLYILSEYQRQGIGRAAFDFIKAYCREHGAKFFTCHCVPENLNARAFYEKMGGEVIRTDLANEEPWQNSVTYRFAAA